MIEFKNITKIYQNKKVVDNLSFRINQGELLVLVGSSGSGKTTTLKMINRLVEADEGEILIRDKSIKEYNLRELRLNTGYVLQQIALFPNLTVQENIELISEMKKIPKKEREEKASSLLEKVGLDPKLYLTRYPSQLSGGEQQRIGILRAIIENPEILLMDEPFSALDPISRKQLQDLIKVLHKEFGMTIVFVTHDMQEAVELGERIAIMKDGKLLQIDTPEKIKEAPANTFVEKFFE